MSKNINQIFISNPASTMQNNDLMYLGRSPYGPTNDMAIVWSNIIASLGGTFLEKANNLSDLSSQLTAYQNFGMGARSQVTYTDSDFPVVLTNPCPNIITLNCSSSGHTLQLPDAQGTQSFELFNGPEIINIGSARVDIVSFLGVPQTPSQPNSDFDYLLVDKSTTGGLWDPRGHVTTVNGKTGNVILASSPQVVYVATNGVDSPGNGSILSPYQTIAYALSQITTASSSTPFTINTVTGTYNEVNIALKPWIYINLNSSSLNVSGSITLDSSWSGVSGNAAIINSSASSFPSSVSLDFNAAGALSVNFSLTNHINIVGATTWNITGTSSGTVFFGVLNVGDNNEFSYNITNCFGRISLGAAGNITLSNCVGYAINYIAVVGSTLITANESVTANVMGCRFIGAVEYQQTGAGNTTVQSRGNIYSSTLTIDKGTGGGNVILDADSLKVLPTLVNGATYNPTYISDSSNANVNFTPVNYTPISGGPGLWSADSVTGNLAGIDLALAGTSIGVYQQLYVNDISGNDSNSGSIAEPMKTYDAARLRALSLGASISKPFVVNMIGVFSITGNMTISPYVSVIGTSDYSTRINFTGNIVLDSGWNSFTSPFCIIRGINFIGSLGINFIYSVFQTGSFIRFENCSLQFSSIAIVGSGTSTACETIVFNNCNTDLSGEPTVGATDVNLYLFNTNPSNNITVSCLSSTTNAKFVLTGSQTRTGNILLNATSSGTLNTIIGSSNTFGKTLEINGSSNTVTIDSTSYQFTLILNGGATLSNLVTPTLTDGMVNTTYPPIAYTPTAGGLFSANTLTGNLKGIDLALSFTLSTVLYVDPINGNDSNNGSIIRPLKTYETARLQAIAGGANSNNPWVIAMMGIENITGDMTISANISIEGLNPDACGFSVSGSVVIDPNWGLSDFAFTQVRNVSLFVGVGYTFTFSHPQDFNFLKFVNVAMNTGGFINITGSGGPSGAETITFENCTNDTINYADGIIAENVHLFLINTDITAGSVTVTASSANSVNYNFFINNARFYTNDITVVTNNVSTLTTFIESSNTMSRTLTINGTNNTVNVDSTSYMFTLALSGGATLANLNLPSLTDGVTNSSYTPSNYTPSAGTNFKSNSLTGNLKGIDNVLPSTTFNGMTAGTAINATSVVVLGSHETKVGSMVTGSIIFSFTSTTSASPIVINFSKSYGSNFSSNIYQAIGSGICAKTPTTAIGDASVQNVQASFPAATIKIIMNVSAVTDYIAEVSFTYQVT